MRHAQILLLAVCNLTLGLLVAPLVAEGQSAAQVYRIGYLGVTPPTTPSLMRLRDAFVGRLAELGYVEGKNLEIIWRFSEGRPERFSALAAEMVGLNVQIIVSAGSQATKAAKDATSTIPVVLIGVAFPVEAGFVASLRRPGGNVTGVTDQAGDIAAKVVELAWETVPSLSRLGILVDFTNPGWPLVRQQHEEAAQRLGLKITYADVRAPDDLDRVLPLLTQERVQALVVWTTAALVSQRRRVAEFALNNRLPTITNLRFMLEDGGLLLAYAPRQEEIRRRTAEYVDLILKGARPADLPVEQPRKFELLIYQKTAKALGLTIPPSVLARADEVIE
jgi:putative ABC transport system substrate-binding protein